MTRDEFISYVEPIYRAARGLIQLTPENKFNYKPMEGVFTVAQLLKHCGEILGTGAYQGLHSDWPPMPEDGMLPPAEVYPAVSSIKKALKAIDEDWEKMKQELEQMSDDDFNTKEIHPPWMPQPVPCVAYMMQTKEHLSNHRTQLFWWLKLSGEDLNTRHLYGI